MHRGVASSIIRVGSSDAAVAAFAGGASFAVYLLTLLPDLGGYEDTPKLQYLGVVLGTAHAPGYPLHTLLSYLFSWLPFGNPAYQTNLLSAVAASSAVGLVVLVARALNCTRAASVSAALTLAFGLRFWNFAVLAEVYSLAALLLLGVLYWLIRWSQSGRRGHLYAAAAFFALGLGNHVTIGVTAPAIALFVFASPARRRLNAATIATAGLIAASGFLQYLYITARTASGAPWVEARVGSLSEFVSLFLIQRYDDFVLPLTWQTLRSVAMPNVAGQAFEELGLVGLVLAAAGSVALMRRDRWVSILVGLSAVATIAVMMRLLGDRQGFLLPAWAVLAIFVAAGADAVHRVAFRRRGRTWSAAVAALLLAYPLLPLWRNFSANDWSRRTSEAEFMRSAISDLPRPAALVREGYVIDSMLEYLSATEAAGDGIHRPPPEPDLLRRLHLDGTPIYAFDGGRSALAAHGFEFEPVMVPGPALAERLRGLPANTFVAIAAVNVPLPADVADVLGIRDPALLQWPRPHLAIVARVGAGSERCSSSVRQTLAGLDIPSGDRLTAAAGPEGAFVSMGGQTLAAVASGMVVAVVDPSGGVREVHTPSPPDFRTSVPTSQRLFRMTRLLPSLPAGGRTWTDVTTAVRHGAIDFVVNNYRPFEAAVTVYATADTPMRPGLTQLNLGVTVPAFDGRVFDRSDPESRMSLERWLAVDGLSPGRLGSGRFVARVHQTIDDGGEWAGWGVAFGALPERVLAWGATDLPNPRRVLAIAPPERRGIGEGELSLINASGYADHMFGPGWHKPEPGRHGLFRWSSADEAYLVLPLSTTGNLEIALTVMPRGDAPASERRLSATLNGHDLGACSLVPGWQSCTWHVPAGTVSGAGNILALRGPSVARPADTGFSTDTRAIGVALRQILIRRLSPGSRAN